MKPVKVRLIMQIAETRLGPFFLRYWAGAPPMLVESSWLPLCFRVHNGIDVKYFFCPRRCLKKLKSHTEFICGLGLTQLLGKLQLLGYSMYS